MTTNGHIRCKDKGNQSAHVSFVVGNTNIENVGDYHIYKNVIGDGWAPLVLTQMHEAPQGTHTISLQFYSTGGTWHINGTGM